jgi:IS5 family transposase
MYGKHHNGQLTIEEFHVAFSGTLDPENRWVLFATLMPSDEIQEVYAPQFSSTTEGVLQSLLAWRLAHCS